MTRFPGISEVPFMPDFEPGGELEPVARCVRCGMACDDGETLCEDCHSEGYVQCEDCGEWVTETKRWRTGERLCVACHGGWSEEFGETRAELRREMHEEREAV